ncbi:hypothetical protein [Actinophytocola sp. KF-1]
MEIEKLIEDTFKAHEHVAPDSDAVLAAARQRIDRKRAVSKPLAVAAGVVVLTLAAVTVVTLNRPSGDGGTQAAGPASGAVTATGPASTTPATPGIPPLTMPYDLGWLPPGDVEFLVHRINTGGQEDAPVFGGEYMLSVTSGGTKLMVDVQEFKMSPVDDAAFKSGPGSPVTINGKHGVESANSGGPGGYELYFEHPEQGSMYVNVGPENGGTADAQQLISYGRKIAQNIRFPGTKTVAPAFGLGALPDGMRMCAFDVEKPFDADAPVGVEVPGGSSARGSTPNTGYSVGACTDITGSINIAVTGVNGPRGAAGQPVQGHKTRFIDEGGYRSLWILGAVGNAPVLVAGRVPAADLYAIAGELVLPAE